MALIMILASLLLPALAKVKAKSGQMTCSGNMRQIALAVISYSGDYHDFAPYGLCATNYLYNYDHDGGIRAYLNVPFEYDEGQSKFMIAPPVSLCPQGRRDGTFNPSTSPPSPNFSYSLNSSSLSAAVSEKIAGVRNPSSRLMLGEIGPDGWYGSYTGSHARTLFQRGYFSFRHFKKGNIVFVDGHLSAVGPDAVPLEHSVANDPADFYRTH
jgi:prepilin-type processing-associated H-X9-DG protein